MSDHIIKQICRGVIADLGDVPDTERNIRICMAGFKRAKEVIEMAKKAKGKGKRKPKC